MEIIVLIVLIGLIIIAIGVFIINNYIFNRTLNKPLKPLEKSENIDKHIDNMKLSKEDADFAKGVYKRASTSSTDVFEY